MSTSETGRVTMDIDGHVCTITVDNVAKKNAYTPAMLDQVAEFMTDFEDNDDLWVAIFCSAGEHTTAGLDMPRFFGPTAEPSRRRPGLVDPFGLERRCTKPVIAVVQGITYTVGIEMALAQDIVIAADTARFQQLESRRGIAPLGGRFQIEAGGRQDLADIEKTEMTILSAYMPASLSEDEVKAEVAAAVQVSGANGPQDMGKVMAIGSV